MKSVTLARKIAIVGLVGTYLSLIDSALSIIEKNTGCMQLCLAYFFNQLNFQISTSKVAP